MKEKTISDTLLFEGDHLSAINQIIQSFDNPLLHKFTNTDSISEILNIMNSYSNYNLRSITYACQKTSDIFDMMQDENEFEFIKCIFYGIIIFTLKFKAGKDYVWNGSNNYSIDLGSEKYPLFRFCFDYITKQYLDLKNISNAKSVFSNLRLYDQYKSIHDHDLEILSYFDLHSESEVIDAVNSVTNRLNNPADISFYEYGNIAAKLILVKHLLDCDINEAKKKLVVNLKNIQEKLEAEALFRVTLQKYNQEIQEEYNQLKNKMISSLETNKSIIKDFDYQPHQANLFYENVCKNVSVFHSIGSFTKSLDQDRLITMFFQSNPAQMSDIRGAFLAVYRLNSIYPFMKEDIPFINSTLQSLKSNSHMYQIDKVQKLQYNYFVQNLEEILNGFNSLI